jgi:hypothetical protein
MRIRSYLVALSLILAFSGTAKAAWYNFARQNDTPEITELTFGKYNLEELVEIFRIPAEDVSNSILVIRGRAEVMDGVIGSVRYSLDGGDTWEKAQLDRSGYFYFELRPDIGREYYFQIQAMDTTGKASDSSDGAFTFILEENRSEEIALATFQNLLNQYTDQNASAFMQMVSDDFDGDMFALEDALDTDFESLSSIIIKPTISRVIAQGKDVEVLFTFERSVHAINDGTVLTDNSQSSMTFRRTEEGYKLYSMAAPLIFGVSGTSEVASTVDFGSVGDEVLVVSSTTGAAAVSEQSEDVADSTSDVVSGSVTIDCVFDVSANDGSEEVCPGFSLSTQNTSNESPNNLYHGTLNSSDFGFYIPSTNCNAGATALPFATASGVGVYETSDTSLDDVASVTSDASEYVSSVTADGGATHANNGTVYAISTGSYYAIIVATDMSCTEDGGTGDGTYTGSFEYKVQMDGTPSFQ